MQVELFPGKMTTSVVMKHFIISFMHNYIKVKSLIKLLHPINFQTKKDQEHSSQD